MSQSSNSNGLFAFISGLLLGVLGGTLVGLLFARKSGDAFRTDLCNMAKTLPEKVNDEFSSPKGRAREFIDKTRNSIETQVDKVKKDRQADRIARAKQAEEQAGGYEFNMLSPS